MTTTTLDKIHTDLKALGADLVELKGCVTDALASKLDTAQRRAGELVQELPAASRQAAVATDQLIKDKPYHAAGVAAVAGVLIGALLARR